MKKLTRKITLSLVAILFAVIALGTTTYAWFTLGTSATVGDVEADVTSGEGIEISLDGKTWVSTLTKEMIQKYIDENYGTGKANEALNLIDLVKSQDGVEFTNSQGDNITKAGSYLKLPIKIRAVGTATNKAVSVSKVTMGSSAYEWTADATVLKDDVTGVTTADATHTVPVVVENEGSKVIRYFMESDCYLVAGKKYKYYASDAARVTFVYGGKVKLTTHSTTENKGLAIEEDKTIATGIAKKYADAKGFTFNATFAEDDTSYKFNTEVTTTDAVIPADQLTTAGVTVDVYVWLNGFDADCINAILGKKITVSFEFKLVA